MKSSEDEEENNEKPLKHKMSENPVKNNFVFNVEKYDDKMEADEEETPKLLDSEEERNESNNGDKVFIPTEKGEEDESEVFLGSPDFTDGPGSNFALNFTDGLLGRFRNGSRSRNESLRSESYRSSTASLDTMQMREIARNDLSTLPSCEYDMEQFAKNLTETFKKSSHMREALKNTWTKNHVNYRCPNGRGNTLLHVAVKINAVKLVSALGHLQCNINISNSDGNCPLHLAAVLNYSDTIESLLKHNAATEIFNNAGKTPLQIAALSCNRESVMQLIKFGADFKLVNSNKETLLHLVCRGFWSRYLDIKEKMNNKVNRLDSVDKADNQHNFCNDLEANMKEEHRILKERTIPILNLLLDLFRNAPSLIKDCDAIGTSPGTILHYFACFNFLEGVKTLMKSPYQFFPSVLNQNQLTPLWIAAFYNHTELATVLLNYQANPNDTDPDKLQTPLHMAIYGYHITRVNETCQFIEDLLNHGADPTLVDNAGENPVHLACGTQDFRVMSKFVNHLGSDSLELRDDTGITLFHYAVGTLDEHSIYNLIERGANLMSKAYITHNFSEDDDEEFGVETYRNGSSNGRRKLSRSHSIVIHRLPLQEAMKNGNSQNYFNALRRMNFDDFLTRLTPADVEEFICSHLLAATREVRPDIVRLLFLQVREEKRLHRILLFCDKNHEDDTFTKTALEWAVENNDRLCTTEILHQEYECHKLSKMAGLKCLRRQLTGDELLNWTIETFSMFYERTFAQRFVIPLFGLFPLFLSIFTFVYDYYSDIELTLEYFSRSTFSQNVTALDRGNVSSQEKSEVICTDYELTQENYRTAFVVNVICICLPLGIFWAMCARELLPFVQNLDEILFSTLPQFVYYVTVPLVIYPGWVVVSLCCAPFFIIFVAARQVLFKFKHQRAKRKNLFRRQLQKSEYYWGIARTAEAGLESCGQLILQVWLLSASFKQLSDASFLDILDMTYTGIQFFLTFSYKPATDTEKSLGKIFMALMALVIGVAGCYRTLKRGAVQVSNTAFIYLSLFFQVFARIFSLGLYFFAVKAFIWNVPIMLAVHFVFVGLIKLAFERARHSKGILAYWVSVLNIAASSLVFVRIVPISKPRGGVTNNVNHFSHYAQEHSTFLVQFLYFSLILIENLALALVPLFKDNGENRAMACLGKDKLEQYVGIVFAFCVLSWIFHTLYYKYMGHPWADINGPSLDKEKLSFSFHFNGKERVFLCKFGVKNEKPSDSNAQGQDNQCFRNCQVSCQLKEDCDETDEFL